MKPIFTVSAAVLLAAISAFPAVAATAPVKAPVAKTVAAKPVKAAPAKAAPKVLTFKKIDANHDGKVSEAELKAVFPKLTKAEFVAADTDKSGALSLSEVAAFFKAHAKK